VVVLFARLLVDYFVFRAVILRPRDSRHDYITPHDHILGSTWTGWIDCFLSYLCIRVVQVGKVSARTNGQSCSLAKRRRSLAKRRRSPEKRRRSPAKRRRSPAKRRRRPHDK
jgi:hypothetical protein